MITYYTVRRIKKSCIAKYSISNSITIDNTCIDCALSTFLQSIYLGGGGHLVGQNLHVPFFKRGTKNIIGPSVCQ